MTTTDQERLEKLRQRHDDEVDALRAALEAKTREAAGLAAWKADALQALAGWHRLGDVLLTLAPARLGVVIPDHLAVAVPTLITSLRATQKNDEACSHCGESHSAHVACRSDWTGVDKHGR